MRQLPQQGDQLEHFQGLRFGLVHFGVQVSSHDRAITGDGAEETSSGAGQAMLAMLTL
jgi:hypothetical protein